ncbi:AzlC family ABC transporter permease [Chthonobacter albigriseus]|uniref:AzlC family ABC transporter permease n=1 Tax=Chthonobacter albigriseus TaxID=1683161 RepID=UPI0015EE9167|nr:AzlC family ABC transporter permease [Chthonobacter albigriseus]
MRSPVVSDIRDGVVDVFPPVFAMIPFALIMGSQAAAKGLSPAEVLAMSTIVFAGASQFLAVSLWSSPAPALTLALAAFLINLRHVLMGASIAHKIEHFGAWRYPAVHFMTDEVWAVAERRALRRPITPAYWFGAGIFLFSAWQLFTVLGAVVGSFVKEPERYGLDFAFPAIFIALALGFWQGWRTAPVIAASALVAVVVHLLVPGAWYVLAGALAGCAVAIVTAKPTEEAAAA